MQRLTSVLSAFLSVTLGGAGLYITAKTNFTFGRHPLLLFRKIKAEKSPRSDGISPFSALCVALGGTVGVGNTVGVASAILLGGPGAVFWMWVSAFLGLSLKYTEVFLAHRYRDARKRGGAMYLLRQKNKKIAAVLFCIFCVLCSLGIGNLAQSASAVSALSVSLGAPKSICGAALCLLCLFVFAGGLKRLARFSQLLVPTLGALFFLACLGVLWQNHHRLPFALLSIVRGAFSFRAAGGGILGAGFAKALAFGFSRGIFSNEAGLGSAPLVHASSDASAKEQALWGSREVFLDTHVVCTLSALCILSSPVYQDGTLSPDTLCSAVFTHALGDVGGMIFPLSLSFFATASMLAWGHYGRCAISFLFPQKQAVNAYFLVFFSLFFLGSFLQVDFTLLFSDLANTLMALLNLYALFLFRKQIPRNVTTQ